MTNNRYIFNTPDKIHGFETSEDSTTESDSSFDEVYKRTKPAAIPFEQYKHKMFKNNLSNDGTDEVSNEVDNDGHWELAKPVHKRFKNNKIMTKNKSNKSAKKQTNNLENSSNISVIGNPLKIHGLDISDNSSSGSNSSFDEVYKKTKPEPVPIEKYKHKLNAKKNKSNNLKGSKQNNKKTKTSTTVGKKSCKILATKNNSLEDKNCAAENKRKNAEDLETTVDSKIPEMQTTIRVNQPSNINACRSSKVCKQVPPSPKYYKKKKNKGKGRKRKVYATKDSSSKSKKKKIPRISKSNPVPDSNTVDDNPTEVTDCADKIKLNEPESELKLELERDPEPEPKVESTSRRKNKKRKKNKKLQNNIDSKESNVADVGGVFYKKAANNFICMMDKATQTNITTETDNQRLITTAHKAIQYEPPEFYTDKTYINETYLEKPYAKKNQRNNTYPMETHPSNAYMQEDYLDENCTNYDSKKLIKGNLNEGTNNKNVKKLPKTNQYYDYVDNVDFTDDSLTTEHSNWSNANYLSSYYGSCNYDFTDDSVSEATSCYKENYEAINKDVIETEYSNDSNCSNESYGRRNSPLSTTNSNKNIGSSEFRDSEIDKLKNKPSIIDSLFVINDSFGNDESDNITEYTSSESASCFDEQETKFIWDEIIDFEKAEAVASKIVQTESFNDNAFIMNDRSKEEIFSCCYENKIDEKSTLVPNEDKSETTVTEDEQIESKETTIFSTDDALKNISCLNENQNIDEEYKNADEETIERKSDAHSTRVKTTNNSTNQYWCCNIL